MTIMVVAIASLVLGFIAWVTFPAEKRGLNRSELANTTRGGGGVYPRNAQLGIARRGNL